MSKVRITSSGGLSNGSKVTTPDGAELKGAVACNIKMEVGEPVKAELTLLQVGLDVEADASFMLVDPDTGTVKAVRRIEFADGSVFEVPA